MLPDYPDSAIRKCLLLPMAQPRPKPLTVPLRARLLSVVGVFLYVLVLSLVGCDAASVQDGDQQENPEPNCSIDTEHLREGTQRGGIVALSDPKIVGPDAEEVSALRDRDRVIALLIGNVPLAIPRKLLNQHEIVNLDWANRALAVTYCPLTVSSLAFDRGAIGGAEFEVSGLLFHDNLVMFDRDEQESLWPQMSRGATCGADQGTRLEMVPVLDLRWGYWRTLHPNTRVLPVQGDAAIQARSPASSTPASAPHPKQTSPPQGTVLGLPSVGETGGGEDDDDDLKSSRSGRKSNNGGLAFPFRRLRTDAGARVVEVTAGMVLFWDEEAQAAMVYKTSSDFIVQDGTILDERTGSVWTIDGRAVEGLRRGEQLEPVPSAHVASWSAWSDFYPSTDVWSP